jgi:excisionase family DNA binding protein
MIIDPLTVAEAASLANVTPQWIRIRCGDGKIAAEKRGGTWLIARSSVEAFLSRTKQRPGRKPR